MEIFIGARQSGKTHRIVQWAKDNPNSLVIVSTYQQKKNLMDRGLSKDQVAVITDNLTGRHYSSFAIDNLELMLSQLLSLNGPVDLVTMTGKPIEPTVGVDPKLARQYVSDYIRSLT